MRLRNTLTATALITLACLTVYTIIMGGNLGVSIMCGAVGCGGMLLISLVGFKA